VNPIPTNMKPITFKVFPFKYPIYLSLNMYRINSWNWSTAKNKKPYTLNRGSYPYLYTTNLTYE
jgi:hypothetical protein